MSSAPHIIRTSILALTSAVLIAACGGGGSSGGGAPPVSPAPPSPVPPPPNRPPEVSLPIANQRGTLLHSFDFDFTQGGRTFTDADGDALTYSVRFDLNNVAGLSAQGTHIVGIPQNTGLSLVTIDVTDGKGNSSNTQFNIIVDPNRIPTVAATPDDLIVAIGAPVDVDATSGGALFSDADGDVLTYQVAVRGVPGLAVNGNRVHGSLANIGAVEVAVTARDDYGGEGVAKFLVAAPGPQPGAPTLPATSYIYEDQDLLPIMPFVMRLEFQFNPANLPPNLPTNAGAALGRVLFYDKRLSITNTVACASCHIQSEGFATSNRFDTGILGIPLKRNSMTLTNSRANPVGALFSDMRVQSLKEVARAALTSNDEMGGRLTQVEAKLRATTFYAPLFAAAFGSPEITGDRVLLALEQYVRTVLSYRSRFDQVCMSVDEVSPVDCTSGFTAQELRGQEIFESNNGVTCALCHKHWTATNIWHANNGIDEVPTDPGTLDHALDRGTRGVFRAPSLRNIARTAPYMHDGRFATLRDVINHYDHDIKASPDLDSILGGPGVPARMDLSEADKDALEAFLRTLTDDAMLADPKFSDPFP